MTFDKLITQLDAWGKNGTPFFFLIDFEKQMPIAFPLNAVPEYITFDFNGITNECNIETTASGIELRSVPFDEQLFKSKFDFVHQHLSLGDSYLTNLTIRSQISMSHSLREIFATASAKYKLLYKDEFLVFSPETFIQIQDDVVYSYPMKGTIDASIDNAEKVVLENKKELAEHVTIVDLIRNDLSQIASDVKVERFRYIDKIVSNNKTLLQVSSEIKGKIVPSLRTAFGSILNCLLPAGSISGAPKPKTVEIIKLAEAEPRGYYTGVAGVFDGRKFDSGVLIRFIEQSNGQYFYRSGGGITTASDWKSEYREVMDKIYVPVN